MLFYKINQLYCCLSLKTTYKHVLASGRACATNEHQIRDIKAKYSYIKQLETKKESNVNCSLSTSYAI